MGVDTKAYWPNATFRAVFQWVTFLAMDATIEEGYTGTKEYYKVVNFTYKGEKRMLHLHKTTIDLAASIKKYGSENVDDSSYIRSGLPDKSRGIMGDFSCWGSSVEIMRHICFRFGGYLDENDCDDKDYQRVNQNGRQAILTLFEGVR